MSNWDKLMRRAGATDEEKEAPTPRATGGASNWDKLMGSNTENGEPQQAAPSVTPSAPSAESEPFQLRMAKAEYERRGEGDGGTQQTPAAEEPPLSAAPSGGFSGRGGKIDGGSVWHSDDKEAERKAQTASQMRQLQNEMQDRMSAEGRFWKSPVGRGLSTVGGALYRGAGNALNTMATLRAADAERNSRLHQYLEDHMEEKTGEPAERRSSPWQQRYDELEKAYINTLQEKADQKRQAGAALLEDAKEGLGFGGRLAVDVGAGATDVLMDMGLNAIAPGAGLAAMGTRAFGDAAAEERAKGGDRQRQLTAGAKSAAIEILTEKIAGPFEKAYGKTALGSASKALVDGIDSPLAQAAIKLLADATGEGAEEILSDLLNPVADKALGLADSWDEAWDGTTLGGVMYDGLLGGILGALGSTGSIMSTKGTVTQADLQRIKASAQQAMERAVEKAAEQIGAARNPATAGNAAQDAQRAQESAGDIRVPPTTGNARTGDSERLNLMDVSEARGADAEQAAQAVEGQEKTAPEGAGESTVANTDPSGHTAAEQDGAAGVQRVAEPDVSAERDTGDGGTDLAPAERDWRAAVDDQAEVSIEQQPGMKRSQTESNTLQGVAEKLGGQQEELYYLPSTEKQTLTEAVNRVMADGVGEMERLTEKTMWTAADIDTAMTIYGKLQADAVRTGNYDAAQSWARVVQSRGTSSGQALQAFSKWTRSGAGQAAAAQARLDEAVQQQQMTGRGGLTQEQAGQISNDIYSFGQDFDGIEDGDLDGIRDLIKRQSKYRNTGTFFEENYGKLLSKETDFDFLKEYALRQMMAIADDYTVQADLGQKMKTWQVNAQLTRLGTFFRNIGGNLTFGVQDTLTQNGLGIALDMLVAKKTGRRTVAADKSWFSSKARKGASDAMRRSILEIAGDVNMSGDASKYGMTANRTFKMNGNGFDRFMSRWEQLLGYSLQTSDAVSRGQIEAAVREGLNGIDSNLSESEIEELAENTAAYRLFQNKGTAYGISKGIHDMLNLVGVGGKVSEKNPQQGRQGGFGVGDMVNPYPGVPANLAVKALEYSPANIVKGGVELVKVLKSVQTQEYSAAKQHQAVMDISRGMVGAPIIALLAAAFKSGVVKNWDDEEDPDAAAQNRAEGKSGVQINLDAWMRAMQGGSAEWRDGDDLMTVGWLEPLNAFMAIASLIAQDGDDATAETYAKHYFNGALQSVLDMPVMQNIANMVDSYNYSTGDGTGAQVIDAVTSLVGDAVTGMIPAPVGQIARTTDSAYRDTTADSKVQQVWNNVRNTIPGLRQTLPEKLDNFGNVKEQGSRGLQRFLNNFVLPGAVNELRQTDTSAAVEDLYKATGDAHVYPDRKAPNTVTVSGESHRLTAEEKREYQGLYGGIVERYTDRLLNSGDYGELSDAEKVELITKIKQFASAKAKKELFETLGLPYSNKTWNKTLEAVEGGEDLLELLLK